MYRADSVVFTREDCQAFPPRQFGPVHNAPIARYIRSSERRASVAKWSNQLYRYLKAIVQRNKSPVKDAPPVHNGFLYRPKHIQRKKCFFIMTEENYCTCSTITEVEIDVHLDGKFPLS